jgi:small subunit ribosomal protein S20
MTLALRLDCKTLFGFLIHMANTSSAKKANRKNVLRTAVNKARRARVRTSWRKVEEALAAGDAAVATEALREAESETMRAVSKGVFHKNLASRKVSRLTHRLKLVSDAARAS